MNRWWAVVGLLLSGNALAERGLVTASLQSGQAVGVAPSLGADRGVPLLATLTYGLSERWSLSASGDVEFAPGGPTLALAVGPHLTLFKSQWWTLEALFGPEVLGCPAARRVDLAVRAGVSARLLLMWGVGVVLEAGARGRAPATGPLVPTLQGYLVGGLYVEA